MCDVLKLNKYKIDFVNIIILWYVFLLGLFYDPMSKEDPYKRITLLPEIITDDTKSALKTLFNKSIDELNTKEANEILVKTCPKESNNVSKLMTRSMSASISTGAKR